MAGRISCLDNEARQGRNREGEERTKRRRRRKVVSLVRRTTQHPFWPGWSPVNLLFMPLSAQISSNDVLGPSSSPFSLLFFPFPFLFLFSFPPPPPPPRLSTFLHVAHVTGLLSSGEKAKVHRRWTRRKTDALDPPRFPIQYYGSTDHLENRCLPLLLLLLQFEPLFFDSTRWSRVSRFYTFLPEIFFSFSNQSSFLK